jgi:hypothetical protein
LLYLILIVLERLQSVRHIGIVYHYIISSTAFEQEYNTFGCFRLHGIERLHRLSFWLAVALTRRDRRSSLLVLRPPILLAMSLLTYARSSAAKSVVLARTFATAAKPYDVVVVGGGESANRPAQASERWIVLVDSCLTHPACMFVVLLLQVRVVMSLRSRPVSSVCVWRVWI